MIFSAASHHARAWALVLGAFILCLSAEAGAQPADALKTVAERSGYQTTARYDDIVRFIDELEERSEHVQRFEFGKSVEGRALLGTVIANPLVGSPAELRDDQRAVVLLLGGIHAGECDGKEAIMAMMREMALDADHRWLKDFVFLVVPQFNVDAGERIGTEHRDEQVGPASGVGRRENAQNLDLNRDFVKLETPEVRALVELMRAWQPHVFIDTHTTNGSRHQYALTYDVPHNPAAPPAPVELLRSEILPVVTEKLRAQNIETFYYGNFNDEKNRWTTYGHQPRYGTEYAGLSGIMSILVESYSYISYEQRIAAYHAFVAACLDEIAARRAQVTEAIVAARRQIAGKLTEPSGDDNVPIRSSIAAFPDPVVVKGFENTEQGEKPKDYEVEFWGRAEPQHNVTRPFAYVIPRQLSRVADRLRMHGLKLEQLTEPADVEVEVYRAKSVERGSSFQNHRLVSCEVEKRSENRTLEPGTYVVPLNQPLGNLIVYLLEPESDDGLVTWNFFEPSFWKAGDDFPVLRIAQPTSLALQSVAEIEPRQVLDLEQIYGAERRVNFNPPFPFEVRWLPGADKPTYSQDFGGRRMLVDAETGAVSDWYDREKLATALDALPELSSEDARRLANDASDLSPDGKALLWNHQGDLYYARLDGSSARRLTFSAEAEELGTFSPDGAFVAFVRENDLYVVDVHQGREWPLTTEGDDQHLFGKLDWVYQEEVYGRGNYKGFWWSPDSRHIALLALDETPVHRYSVLDHAPYRGELNTTPYPKAGDPNPRIRLGMVSVAGGDVRWVEHDEYSAIDHLIVRVTWDRSGEHLYYQVQNREQTWLDLRRVVNNGTRSSKVLRETSSGWIDPLDEPLWLSNGDFLWRSQRSGYAHVYRVTADGEKVTPVTQGEWEVRSVHGVDPQNQFVYFQAAIENRVAEQTYRVPLAGGAPERITGGDGHHTARFDETFQYFINSHSGIHRQPAMQVCRADGSMIHVIAPGIDDHLKYYRLNQPELLRVPARDGYELDAWLIKPPDFDPSKKYPVLCYVYGGPQAPVVRDRWSGNTYLWHQMLAQRGCCIWICDNRSASLHGIRHTWPVRGRLGELELKDLLDSLDWLAKHEWVDADRIGMWGWSYGGYFTSYALTHSQRFRAGIAGAPVTDWRNYDSIYTERLMGLPQENPSGYEASSVVAAADKLHGRLLLVHGDADDNVHLANTLQLTRALQQASQSFDLMVYPQNMHSVTEPRQSRHLQSLMTDFLTDELLGE